MPTKPSKSLSWLLFGLGVVPTGILALVYGTLGFVAGIVSLAFGSLEGAIYICWAAAGVFGLVALGCGAMRFGLPGFLLRRWESIGIVSGLAACVPIFYYTCIDALWIHLPVVASAVCGLFVTFKGAIRD